MTNLRFLTNKALDMVKFESVRVLKSEVKVLVRTRQAKARGSGGLVSPAGP